MQTQLKKKRIFQIKFPPRFYGGRHLKLSKNVTNIWKHNVRVKKQQKRQKSDLKIADLTDKKQVPS